VKEVTIGPLNGNSKADEIDSNNNEHRVVYTLFEEIQNFSNHTGSVKTLSLHASKDAAARSMRAQFDRSDFLKNEYNLLMEDLEEPAIFADATLQNLDGYNSVFKVNAAGNPVFLHAYNDESSKRTELSILEMTIEGPLASTFFDFKLVADLVILHTGITRVLADIIAEYTAPSLFIFEHTSMLPDEGAFAESSDLLALEGGSAPSPELAEATIRDAIRKSELRRIVDVRKEGVWNLCKLIMCTSDDTKTDLLSEYGIDRFDVRRASNGALVSVTIAYDVEHSEDSYKEEETFCFRETVSGSGRYNQIIHI
jgi:hypothetical protein